MNLPRLIRHLCRLTYTVKKTGKIPKTVMSSTEGKINRYPVRFSEPLRFRLPRLRDRTEIHRLPKASSFCTIF
jgi:hypothetical protein